MRKFRESFYDIEMYIFTDNCSKHRSFICSLSVTDPFLICQLDETYRLPRAHLTIHNIVISGHDIDNSHCLIDAWWDFTTRYWSQDIVRVNLKCQILCTYERHTWKNLSFLSHIYISLSSEENDFSCLIPQLAYNCIPLHVSSRFAKCIQQRTHGDETSIPVGINVWCSVILDI